MNTHKTSLLVLGIDPDVERPGVAIYNPRTRRLTYCGAVPLRALLAWLRAGADPHALPGAVPPLPGTSGAVAPPGAVALACVEDTRALPLYARHRAAAASPAARDRMARCLGRLDEVTRLLLDELGEARIPSRSCRPVQKMNAEAFAQATAWPWRTGQEARDAGMLCWGVAVPIPRRDGPANLPPVTPCP